MKKMHSTDTCKEIHMENQWRSKKQAKKKIASGQLHISNPWCGRYMPKLADSICGFTMTIRNEHTFFLKFSAKHIDVTCCHFSITCISWRHLYNSYSFWNLHFGAIIWKVFPFAYVLWAYIHVCSILPIPITYKRLRSNRRRMYQMASVC